MRHQLPHARFPDRISLSYTADQVAAYYGLMADVDCTGQTILLYELGGNFDQSALDRFYAQYNRPSPQVEFIGLLGETNDPTANDDADGEVMLDIVCAGAARGAKIAVAKAPNSDAGFSAIAQHHLSDARKPIGSVSWGQYEQGWDTAGRRGLSALYMQIAAAGMNVFVAAGDNGSSDGASGNNVDFPASDPSVIGVGGTTLVGGAGGIQSEVVWNDGPGGGATGGGYSALYQVPSYQNGLASIPGRGVPDVAANADPQTGYLVPLHGGTQVIGGTSAAAPLWAAICAGLQAKFGKPISFLNPQFYRTAAGFRDIISGNNGNYIARAGWDPCTGLGTPVFAKLLAALSGTALPPPPPAPPPAQQKALFDLDLPARKRKGQRITFLAPLDMLAGKYPVLKPGSVPNAARTAEGS
jgi:kumamolisin